MRRKVGFVARSLVLVKSNSNQKLEKIGLPSRTRPIASKIVCHLSSVIAIVIVIVRPSFWISHDDAEGRGTIEKTTSVADAESVAEAESVADAEAESVAVAEAESVADAEAESVAVA